MRFRVDGETIGDFEGINFVTGAGTTLIATPREDTGELNLSVGTQSREQVATVTADSASGYVSLAVFDLSQEAAVFSVRMEIMAADADGENWGSDAGSAGDIVVVAGLKIADTEALSWRGLSSSSFNHWSDSDTPMAVVGDYITYYGLTPRFLGVYLDIYQLVVGSPAEVIYAGTHFPSVTAALTLRYA